MAPLVVWGGGRGAQVAHGGRFADKSGMSKQISEFYTTVGPRASPLICFSICRLYVLANDWVGKKCGGMHLYPTRLHTVDITARQVQRRGLCNRLYNTV